MSLRPAENLRERFILGITLGLGTRARVLLAKDRDTRKHVALKVPLGTGATLEDFQHFECEFEFLSSTKDMDEVVSLLMDRRDFERSCEQDFPYLVLEPLHHLLYLSPACREPLDYWQDWAKASNGNGEAPQRARVNASLEKYLKREHLFFSQGVKESIALRYLAWLGRLHVETGLLYRDTGGKHIFLDVQWNSRGRPVGVNAIRVIDFNWLAGRPVDISEKDVQLDLQSFFHRVAHPLFTGEQYRGPGQGTPGQPGPVRPQVQEWLRKGCLGEFKSASAASEAMK